MRVREVSEEVLFGDDRVIKVSRADMESLKERARHNPRKRIRLCAHKDVEDKLHEMLIVHTKDTYVRPHKHLTKSESFHVIEGSVDVVIFDEAGGIVEVIQMGDYSSGRRFYYRISEPCYHTLLISSDFLVFHETVNGPFRKADTVFPSWAPDENDAATQKQFIERLVQVVEGFLSKGEGHINA